MLFAAGSYGALQRTAEIAGTDAIAAILDRMLAGPAEGLNVQVLLLADPNPVKVQGHMLPLVRDGMLHPGLEHLVFQDGVEVVECSCFREPWTRDS